MSNNNVRDEAVLLAMKEIIHNYTVCTLATESNGKPWATSMFFALDGMHIYCIVEDRGEGMKKLKNNPNVALAIDNQIPNQFVQLAGTAEVVQGDEDVKGRTLVLGRVPEYKPFFEMVATSVVKITLKRIHVTDVPRGWFPAKVVQL